MNKFNDDNAKTDPDIQCPNHLMRLSCVKCGLVVEDKRYPGNMTHEQWRHELAARAMEGFRSTGDHMDHYSKVAGYSYKQADAMLEEGDTADEQEQDE